MKTTLYNRLSGINYFPNCGKIFFTAFILFSSLAMAQPGLRRGTPPPPRREGLQTVSTYQGSVTKLVTNDDYVYDGFYILSNNENLLVKFPSHLGSQVVAVVKPGAVVSVSGVYNINPFGEKEVAMLNINANGKTISDEGAPFPPSEPIDTYVSGGGSISQLQKNREGEMNGIIIDGKTILKIPPHIGWRLGNLLQNNAKVSYTGMKKANNSGEASYGNYSLVRCKTLTINGQQYLVE